jgi:hypothetical protein
MLVRDKQPTTGDPAWELLNGEWQFAIDSEARIQRPQDVQWTCNIVVPFAPETPMSGVNNTEFYKAVWYKLTRKIPALQAPRRLILHFGAVDFEATVWVNGTQVAHHEGGYTPFFADITDALGQASEATIVVRAFDNPHDLYKNRGKQDWERKAHGIWYARTTGIWQSVWWEAVEPNHIARLNFTPCMDDWTIGVAAEIAGLTEPGLSLELRFTCNQRTLAHVTHAMNERDARLNKLTRRVDLDGVQEMTLIPDDWRASLRHWLCWSPEHPNLVQVEATLRNAQGETVDKIASYCAFRKFERIGSRLFLNGQAIRDRKSKSGRPGQLRLMLEQGYWRESGMTPPSDEAIERDVLIAKSVCDGVRKHNKLEDPRYLYYADLHGLLVWEELPSAYLFDATSVQRSIQLWTEAIERDKGHPCIIVWVPVNESWQVPQLPASEEQRQFVRTMYYLTKTLTDGALVVGNDGWEMPVSDILAVHDYHHDPEVIRNRYADTAEGREHLFNNERPGGRVLLVGGMQHHGLPLGITEFGGIALSSDPATWGYSVARSSAELQERFVRLMDTITSLSAVEVFCYTELFDAYQEANGLFTMDRQPKFDLEVMRRAVHGEPSN